MRTVIAAFLFLSFFGSASSLFAAKRCVQEYVEVGGQVYVTSKLHRQLNVEWQTSLADTMVSKKMSSAILPGAIRQRATSGVEWFKDETKSAPNAQVYTIKIAVNDLETGELLAKKTFVKTLHPKQLFEKKPANLFIDISRKGVITIDIRQ